MNYLKEEGNDGRGEKMDKESNPKTRGIKKISSQKRGRENNRKRTGKGGTLKKSKNIKKSSLSRNSKKTEKEKIILVKRSILDPIKERMLLAAEYITILEFKKNIDKENDIIFLMQFLDLMYKQSNVYLSYILDKEINNGRNSELRIGC